jgi:CRP/FNR family transcriptional regulator
MSVACLAEEAMPDCVRSLAEIAPAPYDPDEVAAHRDARQRTGKTLRRLQQVLAPSRRLVRVGDAVYRVGERFTHLHILNTGLIRLVSSSHDGREHVVGVKFRGGWLGFDGIASGQYTCDAIAMDIGELWSVRYDELLVACGRHADLLTALHEEMSLEITRDRDSLMSVCTLPVDARVADFLHCWVESLARQGLRTDEITLRMTRAEIGSHLGMTLESVSRAFSKLARSKIIDFACRGHRNVQILDVRALSLYAQEALAPMRALPRCAPQALPAG